MNIDNKILIISLIFAAVLYILGYIRLGVFFANSFLVGAFTSTINFFALARLARTMIGKGFGWLFVPLGILRWALFLLVIFIALHYYKMSPVALLIGVGVPIATMFSITLYYIVLGDKDGASA